MRFLEQSEYYAKELSELSILFMRFKERREILKKAVRLSILFMRFWQFLLSVLAVILVFFQFSL